jgi:hypothetical protein
MPEKSASSEGDFADDFADCNIPGQRMREVNDIAAQFDTIAVAASAESEPIDLSRRIPGVGIRPSHRRR